MLFPEKTYAKIFVGAGYAVLISLFFYIIWNYVFYIVLPFLLGWLTANLLEKPITYLKNKTNMKRAFWSVVSVSVFLAFLFFLLCGITFRLYSELGGILDFLSKNIGNITGSIEDMLSGLSDSISSSNAFRNSGIKESFISGIENSFSDYLVSMLTEIVEKIPSVLASIIQFVPKTLIFFAIFITSAYYFSLDYHKIRRNFLGIFSAKWKEFVISFKNEFLKTVGKYARAYLLILFITFIELFIGFSAIGIKYSFLLSLFISLVYILPILGTGTVIIPWAIVSMFQNNYYIASSLLFLYVIITVVRQFIEPKIVGSFIGLHPLVSLMAFFLGLQLLGVFGMFLFPITIIIFKRMKEDGKLHFIHKKNNVA